MTETEQEIARIYSAVLEIDDVFPEDDIFVLGGDSLHVIRITLELQRLYGIEMTPDVLAKSSEVRQLASWLDAEGASARRQRAT